MKKGKKKYLAPKAPWKIIDCSNDPFFIQKAEASKRVIEKCGLPKGLRISKN